MASKSKEGQRVGRRYRKRDLEGGLARLTINLPEKDKKVFEDQARARGITVSRMVTDAALANMMEVVAVTFRQKCTITVTLKDTSSIGQFLRLIYAYNSGDVVRVLDKEIVLNASNLSFLPETEEIIAILQISFESSITSAPK